MLSDRSRRLCTQRNIVYVSIYVIFLKCNLTHSGRKHNNDFLRTRMKHGKGQKGGLLELQKYYWGNRYVILNVVMDENIHMSKFIGLHTFFCAVYSMDIVPR